MVTIVNIFSKGDVTVFIGSDGCYNAIMLEDGSGLIKYEHENSFIVLENTCLVVSERAHHD